MRHQRIGLRRLIETRGVCALLWDPGLGKTAATLDYLSLLALKATPNERGVREARALVVAPLSAVDTWVLQAKQWVSPQIDYWAEALGGSIIQRAEALASRGGNPIRKRGAKPLQKRDRALAERRALHVQRSHAVGIRGNTAKGEPVQRHDGPGAFDRSRPRLILASLNLDTFSQRREYGSGTTADLLLDAVRRFDPDVIVVDEMHKIKGASSNVSRLLDRIGQRVPRRIGLTGTVMPHGPLDVFGQWRFIAPEAFGDKRSNGTRARATLAGFKRRYAEMGGYMGYEVVGYKNLDDMQNIMAANSHVARKDDELDLPKTRSVTIPVELSSAERRAYTDMKKHLQATFAQPGTSTAPNRLAQMMRLRQITSGYLPDDSGTMRDIGTSKADVIGSIVNDQLAGENRVVVFAQFVPEIARLRAKLATKGTTVEVIDGSVKAEERLAIRQRFGDTAKHPERIVLVAQFKTVSLSVNELVTASHAVFGSLSLQRDDLIQAQDRLNRMGQKRPVTFWFALVPGSVDAVIYKSHQDRSNLEAAVLDHIQSDAHTPGIL